jgi:hypothetical protein
MNDRSPVTTSNTIETRRGGAQIRGLGLGRALGLEGFDVLLLGIVAVVVLDSSTCPPLRIQR